MPRIPYLSIFDVVFLFSYEILFIMMCVAAESRVPALIALVIFFCFLSYFWTPAYANFWSIVFGFIKTVFRFIKTGSSSTAQPCSP